MATPYNPQMLSPRQMRVDSRIIAFSGKMHSGKTTAMEILDNFLIASIYYTKTIKFAAPLYDIQNYVYARSSQKLEGSKDRELLQYIGTDWGRKKDPNIWLNAWRSDVRTFRLKGGAQKDDTNVVLCDDVRFSNEAQMIKDMRGVIIHVEAPEDIRRERSPKTFKETGHSSENGIPAEYITHTLYNDKDIYYLRTQIRALIEQRLI